jgi:Tfp pilus assembly protein PilN
MRALELDFFAERPKGTRMGLLLLFAGAIAMFILFSSYEEMQRKEELLQGELERLERRAQGMSAEVASVDESTVAEIRMANAVIDQLALPWERMFRAIEGAAFDKVVLIGITPDARNGTVEIVGESTDREAMVDYVRRLEARPELTGVYLLSHQYEKRRGVRPYRFTVSGSWLKG